VAIRLSRRASASDSDLLLGWRRLPARMLPVGNPFSVESFWGFKCACASDGTPKAGNGTQLQAVFRP